MFSSWGSNLTVGRLMGQRFISHAHMSVTEKNWEKKELIGKKGTRRPGNLIQISQRVTNCGKVTKGKGTGTGGNKLWEGKYIGGKLMEDKGYFNKVFVCVCVRTRDSSWLPCHLHDKGFSTASIG